MGDWRRRGWSALKLLALLLYAVLLVLIGAYASLARPLYNDPTFNTALRALPIVGGVFALGLTVWLLRSGERRLARIVGLLATGLAAFLVARYAVNVSDTFGRIREQTHIVQYGGFAALFVALYRRSIGDASVYGFAFAASVVVSLVNETLQWALAARVGEIGDVKLDAASTLVGLLFMVSVVEAWRPRRPVSSRNKATLLHATALLVLLLAAFIHRVHLGHEVHEPGLGSFVSRFTEPELATLSSSWRPRPSLEQPAWRRVWRWEDFFAAEALYHVNWRIRHMMERRPLEALKEQGILERYYASYLRAYPDKDLTQVNKQALVAAAGEDAELYPYRGGPHHLVAWLPVPALWLSAALLATLLALVAELVRLRA